MNTFGDFLYTLRKEKGMTQAELAEALGVTNKAVSKWETGEAMPETGLLLPISEIFGVSVDELLKGERNGAKETEDTAPEYEEFDFRQHFFTRGKDDANKTLLEKISGAICGLIFFIGTVTYLILGAVYNLWHPCWVIISDSALLCAIVGIIFDVCNSKKRRQKIVRGENPYTGAACGIIMLTCVAVYLFLGAVYNLWHPYWIIVAGGGVLCGIVGSIGEIISHGKKDR
ncbi:MAG: helix-turn-helix domain-containing protein [Clostridia bacterium]|nr:helix-turn-helix domain-containing protein [Clostridia bacterium]